MFKWNGSDITNFINDERTVIEEATNEKNKYWKITNGKKSEICLIRSSTNTQACLIDEIKPVFKLEKIGTQWFKFKGKNMILLKPHIEKNYVVEDLSLDELGFNKEIETEVQNIFIFREILGMSKNFEKSIILRNKGFYIKPISFYDPNMNPIHEGKVIPETIINKWFKNTDLDEAVLKLFKIDKLEDITNLLLNLKTKLDEIFLRVDPNLITNIDEILTRIRSRLQFILK